MGDNGTATRERRQWGGLLPGLALAGAAGVVAVALSASHPALSPLVLAVVLGIVAGNARPLPVALRPGLRVAARALLRVGVVLLGLRLVAADIVALGPAAVPSLLAVVAVALVATRLLARPLGVSRHVALLAGTGFAICGASAIAAAQGIIEAEEEDVATAVGLVILFGSASIALLPLAGHFLGLEQAVVGAWIGAAVHDVGQVVAAAGVVGDAALERAVVVKLGRVLLLGPLLVVVAVTVRRARPAAGGGLRSAVPVFVVGFLVAVAARSLGFVPPATLAVAAAAERVLFASALFAIGSDVRLRRLRSLGPGPLVLGAMVYVLVGATALVAALLALGAAGG